MHPADRLSQGVVARHRRHARGPGRLLRRQDRGRFRQVQGQAQRCDRADRPSSRGCRPLRAAGDAARPTRTCSSWPTRPSPRRFGRGMAGQAARQKPGGQAGRRSGSRTERQARGNAPAAAQAAGTPAASQQPPGRRGRFSPEMRAQMELAREEDEVPGRRGRRAAGRSQHPGRRRHALRRQRRGARGRGLPHARTAAGGPADLGLGQGRTQDSPPDRRRQGALQPAGPDDRAGREAQDGRRPLGPVPRRRPDGLQHDRRDPRHRPEGRARHAGRPHGFLAQRHRRDRQRGRRLGGDGGRAHPQGARPQAAADDPHRPLERRGSRACSARAPT